MTKRRKYYLTQKQKQFLWEYLNWQELWRPELLNHKIYAQWVDLAENYDDNGNNCYPYQIVDEENDWELECITEKFMKRVLAQ